MYGEMTNWTPVNQWFIMYEVHMDLEKCLCWKLLLIKVMWLKTWWMPFAYLMLCPLLIQSFLISIQLSSYEQLKAHRETELHLFEMRQVTVNRSNLLMSHKCWNARHWWIGRIDVLSHVTMGTLVRLGSAGRLCRTIKFDREVLDLGALGVPQDFLYDAGITVSQCHLENKSLATQRLFLIMKNKITWYNRGE